MRPEVIIIDGPLPPARTLVCEGAGAIVVFEGVVRAEEDGRTIAALVYEAYEPMASATLARLAEHVTERHGLLGVRVEHSRGRVQAGQCSFRLQVASRHRKAALAAMDEFIDRMKADVPIWKTPT